MASYTVKSGDLICTIEAVTHRDAALTALVCHCRGHIKLGDLTGVLASGDPDEERLFFNTLTLASALGIDLKHN